MFKMIVYSLIGLLCAAGAAFSTDYKECFDLGLYFGKEPAAIHQKIDEYQAKLKNDSKDYYADLAVGVLYSALSSPFDNPEEGASKEVVEYTEKFLKIEPANTLGLIYNGLGHSLISRDSSNVIVKVFEVNKASDVFDQAVKLSKGAENEWYIRFMRANFYVNLPDFFNKMKTAEEDYRFVETYYAANPSIETSMVAAYYYLGEMEKTKGDIDKAVSYWKKSTGLQKKLKTSFPEGKYAQKKLDIYED